MSVNFNEIEGIIREHTDQQPISCVCNDCGRDLKFEVNMDNDMDLSMIVFVCDCAEARLERAEHKITDLERERLYER